MTTALYEYQSTMARHLTPSQYKFVQAVNAETTAYERNELMHGRPGYMDRYERARELEQIAYGAEEARLEEDDA